FGWLILNSCEHYNHTNRSHFITYKPSKGMLYCNYLEALFTGDSEEVTRIEQGASNHGYGPLAECTTVSNFSSQCIVCSGDHQNNEGQLISLEMMPIPCCCKFTFFTLLEAYHTQCPYVLMICSGMHEHPVPMPMTMPARFKDELFFILRSLDQDLVDTTSCHVLCHSTVQAQLRQILSGVLDPTFSDLHMSLVNRDHLQRYIQIVKAKSFPHGTGWQGKYTLPIFFRPCHMNDLVL
ncbi:hypothetical protein K439DRAFT_1348333, partial [Ramaria rubella]